MFQCRVDGYGAGHIDAGIAQQIERILGAAGLKEAQILLQFLAPAAEHALGECDRGRQAGRVLVDVEGPVEVRNPQTLEGQFLVQREIGSEVGLQQLLGRYPSAPARSAVRRVRPVRA